MKEIVFIHENSQKWKDFEKKLNETDGEVHDDISKLYIQVTDDLSYANTYFPGSDTAAYLNQLALRAHQHVYRTKKEKKNILVTFWKYSFPLLVFKHRKLVLYTAVILFAGLFTGALSSGYDNTFVKLIMGDKYMDMTQSNIDKNDPFAVYKSMNEPDLFFAIAANNIYVAIRCFVLGIFLILGSVYFILRTGIMLGAFHYFWLENGYFNLSLRTVFLHGTLEIFSIIIAGAAGILIGYSFLFPGTYSRIDSLKQGSQDAVKLMIGIIPFFILAAIIEGFVTRHYLMPVYVSTGIIGTSIVLIAYYFFIYPKNLLKNTMENNPIKLNKTRDFGDVFNDSFAFIKQEFKPLGSAILIFALPLLLISSIGASYISAQNFGNVYGSPNFDIATYISKIILMMVFVILAHNMLMVTVYSYFKLYQEKGSGNFSNSEIFSEIMKNFFPCLGVAFVIGIIIMVGFVLCILPGIYLGVSLSFVLPIMILENRSFGASFSRSFDLTHKQFWWTFLVILVYTILVYVFSIILSIPAIIFGITSVFKLKNMADASIEYPAYMIIYNAVVNLITNIFYVLLHIAIIFQYYSITERFEGKSLSEKIDQITPNDQV